MLEVAVTLYDCVSSHFPPCVSYSCAVRCNTHLPLLQQFFRTPLAGKRRDTYRSIFLVRVFLLFLFSDPLLALQQRSSEVREGRHLVLHQMQHFLSRPRPRASRLLLLNLPYRLRCVNNKFSCDLLFSCLTPIQVDATTSLQLMELSASMSDIRSPRICMPCTLMCRLRIDSTRAVELGLARAWITSIVGIIRRRTRVCIAFSFLATELTFFLVMDPGMGSSGCTTSCF